MSDARPTNAGVRVLTSRIGWRLIAMFAVCAVLPLVGFAGLALDQVSRHLADDAENRLQLDTQNSALALAGRISSLAADLERARALLLDPSLLPPQRSKLLGEQLGERLLSLCAFDSDRAEQLYGERRSQLPVLQPQQARHLATGLSLLQVHPQPGRWPAVTMLRRVGDGTLLAAAVRPDFLFGAEDLRASGAEFLLLAGDGELLTASTAEVPDLAPLQAALQQQPASGTIRWQLAAAEHLAHYWRLFRPQYGIDLLLVQSRTRASVLAPLHGFQRLFTLTAVIALLVVTVTVLVQIRRTLNPIADLQLAIQRVAAGDLDTPAPTAGKDEFGDLARSFNYMTRQLRDSIQKREASERQLVAARDDALAAVRAKAEFLTNVSHELRTPLTSILAYAELLTTFPAEDEQQRAEFLQVISEQALHLTALIDRVLDLSVCGQWQLRPTDVAETLQAAIEMLPAHDRPRVRLQLPQPLPRLPAVADRLSQLWGLLLDNACKFSPAPRPIDVRAELRDGDQLAVTVTDHGDGIAADNLSRIFEPFCQVGRDIMTGKARGVGLGLTLARNIVQRHGGRIEVESQLGQGSTFAVLLPLQLAAAAARS